MMYQEKRETEGLVATMCILYQSLPVAVSGLGSDLSHPTINAYFHVEKYADFF